MRGAIPPLPQYVFMAWYLAKHRDKFTFYLFTNRAAHGDSIIEGSKEKDRLQIYLWRQGMSVVETQQNSKCQ
jgi:hypothetical protein